LTVPLVLLAGFTGEDAAEVSALLAGECRVSTVRSARAVAVLCLGPLLSPIEARHLIAETAWAAGGRRYSRPEAGGTSNAGVPPAVPAASRRRDEPLVLLTAAGPEPAMFQDLIDADRLFYLSPGELPPRDLAALVRAALERPRTAAGVVEAPVNGEAGPVGMLRAVNAARRIAAQSDLASAGDLLQLAAEESVDADRVYCLLYDPAGEMLWSRGAGMAGEERHESSAVGLVSFVARTGRPARLQRAAEDPRFEREADDPLGERCEYLLAMPVSEAPVLAVLCAVRDPGRAPFSAADEAALALLAAMVAPSLAQLALATRLAAAARGRSAGIFREEALEHHAAAGAAVGDWLRLSPRWTSAAFWLLAGLVAAFLGFAAVGRIDERSTGAAVVRLSGRTEVTASQAGLVIAVEVKPGHRVSAGDVLVRFQNARETADLARVEREWELQLVERLRDLSAPSPAQALIGLRAERDLARSRLDERLVRAPRAGIVGDLRCRPDQHVAAGDILLSLNVLSLTGADSRPALTVLLPGEHRPLLRPGMPLNLELRGYAHAPQRLFIAAVSDDVIGPEEAKRLLGPEVATAVPLNGSLVRVEAFFPRDTFEARGERYALHDGMWGTAEVPVRSESLLVALVPGLRAVWERLR
jgi:membrane fusion protein (multidrug efflux system)